MSTRLLIEKLLLYVVILSPSLSQSLLYTFNELEAMISYIVCRNIFLATVLFNQ